MADTLRRKESLVRAILPGLEFREAADGKRPVLSGHFSVFNSPTTIRSAWEGSFVETIAPGAFKKTIAENRDRMRVLLNHGSDPELGDKPLGQIQDLREDKTGAYYEVGLFDGIPPLVMDGLRAGAYGASFRFSVISESWDDRPKRSDFNPDGLPERTIKEAKVAEFGPVTFGAYDDATAGVRSLTDRFLLDALAEDPENLRELIQDRRSRTFTASAPNVRVTYGPKDPERAVWDTSYVNDLPDSAFLYVEDGGKKDADGKTVPRTLRHFPVKDSSGKVDLPHLRNALARIPQSDLPAAVKAAATAKAQKMLAAANSGTNSSDVYGEQRLDAEDLDCLGQMLTLGSQYIAEQDEPDDAANIPKMEAILADLAALVPVEVNEDEPADDDDEMNSADIPEDAEERQISEPPTPPVAGTPQHSREPELSVATTRTQTDETGLYLPNRKDTPPWHLT